MAQEMIQIIAGFAFLYPLIIYKTFSQLGVMIEGGLNKNYKVGDLKNIKVRYRPSKIELVYYILHMVASVIVTFAAVNGGSAWMLIISIMIWIIIFSFCLRETLKSFGQQLSWYEKLIESRKSS